MQFTGDKEGYKNLKDLPQNANFFLFQDIINGSGRNTPSHLVIKEAIARNGSDYRYEVSPIPVKELADRKKDNICVGVKPDAAKSTDFTCNIA